MDIRQAKQSLQITGAQEDRADEIKKASQRGHQLPVDSYKEAKTTNQTKDSAAPTSSGSETKVDPAAASLLSQQMVSAVFREGGIRNPGTQTEHSGKQELTPSQRKAAETIEQGRGRTGIFDSTDPGRQRERQEDVGDSGYRTDKGSVGKMPERGPSQDGIRDAMTGGPTGPTNPFHEMNAKYEQMQNKGTTIEELRARLHGGLDNSALITPDSGRSDTTKYGKNMVADGGQDGDYGMHTDQNGNHYRENHSSMEDGYLHWTEKTQGNNGSRTETTHVLEAGTVPEHLVPSEDRDGFLSKTSTRIRTEDGTDIATTTTNKSKDGVDTTTTKVDAWYKDGSSYTATTTTTTNGTTTTTTVVTTTTDKNGNTKTTKTEETTTQEPPENPRAEDGSQEEYERQQGLKHREFVKNFLGFDPFAVPKPPRIQGDIDPDPNATSGGGEGEQNVFSQLGKNFLAGNPGTAGGMNPGGSGNTGGLGQHGGDVDFENGSGYMGPQRTEEPGDLDVSGSGASRLIRAERPSNEDKEENPTPSKKGPGFRR
jgi:hypothetical protein